MTELSERERMALHLQEIEGKHCPAERAGLAQVARRSLRTLRNWKKSPRGGRRGRPPRSVEEKAKDEVLVRAEMEVQGWTASAKAIGRVLWPKVPTRSTQDCVRKIKAVIEKDKRERLEAERLHICVLHADVLTSLDQTHVAREPVTEAPAAASSLESRENHVAAAPAHGIEAVETPGVRRERRRSRGRGAVGSPCKGSCRARRRRLGRAIQALVAVDVATTLKTGIRVLHSAKGKDVIALLLDIYATRGRFPLVVMTDNGSENVNEDVERFLEEHGIIHLRSLPHTPRHNPFVERAHKELKAEAVIDMMALDPALPLIERVRISLDNAAERLNTGRLRESRGWKTAAVLDNELRDPYALVERAVFYAAASDAMRKARSSPGSSRQQRLAERWALLGVMQDFGLIKLFRGGVPITAAKAEVFT